jgi:hypothetical protein
LPAAAARAIVSPPDAPDAIAADPVARALETLGALGALEAFEPLEALEALEAPEGESPGMPTRRPRARSTTARRARQVAVTTSWREPTTNRVEEPCRGCAAPAEGSGVSFTAPDREAWASSGVSKIASVRPTECAGQRCSVPGLPR